MSAASQQRGRIKGFRIGLRIVRQDVKHWKQKRVALEATLVARQKTGNPESRVSESLIAMIESGQREPSYEVAEWIAEALGKTVADLCLVDDDEAA